MVGCVCSRLIGWWLVSSFLMVLGCFSVVCSMVLFVCLVIVCISGWLSWVSLCLWFNYVCSGCL